MERFAKTALWISKLKNNIPNGTYIAEWTFENKSKGSTFFPDHWQKSQVIEAIFESLKNIKKIVVKKDRWEIAGYTKDGIELLTIIELNKNHNEAKIITSYPVKESHE